MHGWILADLECETKPPVCCGNTMTLVEEKPADLGKEKHMPVNTPANGVYDVTVGEVPHPMLVKNFIKFIALATSKEVYRKFLLPDEETVVFFSTKIEAVSASALCNIHGLWKSSYEINFRQKFSEMDHFYPMRSFSL